LGTWTLLQIVFDIFMALGLFVVIMRMSRAPKDDPRLSRGLQLLQSKISVLEDLSDRTELQVNQLTAILENKAREVQAKVHLAEQTVHEIRVSMERSLDVAKIFQDKIPHAEIIERQNTIKYVQAARLAHQGMSVEEIAEKVDLPKGELEFVAKVNREQLTFSEEQLPWWAKEGAMENGSSEQAAAQATQDAVDEAKGHDENRLTAPSIALPPEVDPVRLRAEIELAERQRLVENLSRLQTEMQNLDQQHARDGSKRNMTEAFEVPKVETSSLQKLGDEFRKACEKATQDESRSPFLPPLEQLTSLIPQVIGPELEGAIKSKAESFANKVSEAFSGITLPSQPPSQLQSQSQPQAQAPAPAPVEVPPQKPVNSEEARAAAQAKVKAALDRGRANEAAAKMVINGKGESAINPVIRKMEFRKIEDTGPT
jgi:hypothetical protein